MNYSQRKSKLRILAFVLSVTLLTFTACENDDDQKEANIWTFELVDSIPGSDAGLINRIAYDAQGGLHMAYTVATGTNTSLRYAYKAKNGSWTSTEVCPKLYYPEIDMVLDPTGIVYIVYEPDTDESIHLAIKNQAGTFDDVLVDVLGSRNYQGRYPAAFAADNGTIHITFDRANFGLRYTAYIPGTGFSPVETLDDTFSGSVADLAVDTDGNISIIYQSGSNIVFAYGDVDSSYWQVNSIYNTEEGSQAYEGINLVMDDLGNLHGVFRKGQADNNLLYMTLSEGASDWSFQTLQINNGSNRTDRAIACDNDNNPRILFDQMFGLYMAKLNTTWEYELIKGDADSRCDSNYDIQIDDNNRAHVSFHNRTNGVLYYATKMLE